MDSPRDNTEIIRLQDTFASNLLGRRGTHFSGDQQLSRSDASGTKSQIIELCSSIQQLERANKRARIDYESNIDSLRNEQKKHKDEKEMVDIRAQGLSTSLMKIQEQLNDVRNEKQKLVTQYEHQVMKLGKEKKAFNEERDQIQEAKKKMETEKEEEIWHLQSELNTYKLDKEEAERRYELQTRRVEELREQLDAAEKINRNMTKMETKMKELQSYRDQYEEDMIVVKNLKVQYKNFPEVSKEYVVLKNNQENYLLQTEKLASMTDKYQRVEQQCREFNRMQQENEELKRQLNKWTEITSPMSFPKTRSVEDLLHQLANLQNSEAVLLQNQSKLQSRVLSLQESSKIINAKHDDLLKTMASVRSQHELLENKMKRLERKTSLIKLEREHYREIIDSYERDCTMQVPSSLVSQSKDERDKVALEMEQQCRDLESQLELKNISLQSRQQTIKQLETQLQDAKKDARDTCVVSETDKNVTTRLRNQICQLENKLEAVSEEKFKIESILERRHLQGHYDPHSVKVLQLSDNPASMAQRERADEVTRLTEENRQLSERVKLLEENEGRIQDLTLQVERNMKESSSSEEIDEMKAKLESAELKNTRLIEAFKKTSHDLRTACYCLTGYQINITSTLQYRVTHMYSTSPDDYLLFMPDSSGGVQLMETPYSRTLTDPIDLYLNQKHSLPAFMSTLALDLFSKHTDTTL